jgi:hypothetical protein
MRTAANETPPTITHAHNPIAIGRAPIALIELQRTVEPKATRPAPSKSLLVRTIASCTLVGISKILLSVASAIKPRTKNGMSGIFSDD